MDDYDENFNPVIGERRLKEFHDPVVEYECRKVLERLGIKSASPAQVRVMLDLIARVQDLALAAKLEDVSAFLERRFQGPVESVWRVMHSGFIFYVVVTEEAERGRPEREGRYLVVHPSNLSAIANDELQIPNEFLGQWERFA